MEVKVLYYSRSGNTKKLADCIAKTANVKAQSIDEVKDVEADVLFLGASVYAYGIDSKVKKFIEKLDSKRVKKVVVFSTSALAQRAYPDIKKRLENSNLVVSDENFYCRGEFLSLHKGRPNENDLKAAVEFTKKVLA